MKVKRAVSDLLLTADRYLAENNFWCQVLRSATKRPCSSFHTFGKTKICHLNNITTVKQKPNTRGAAMEYRDAVHIIINTDYYLEDKKTQLIANGIQLC